MNEIQSANWQNLFNNNSSSSIIFDVFYAKLSEIIDFHIPVRKLSKRKLKIQSKPWITSAIRKSIQVKNKFYKKYLKTKSLYYHSKFKFYRNKLNHLKRISKSNYYSDYFNRNSNNSKLVWKGIKQIIRVNPKTNESPAKTGDENREITDKKEISNTICEYFSNTGKQLADAIPNVDKESSSESFCIFPVTSQETVDEISKLMSGKDTGSFSIPVKILKVIKYVISKPLEILFNAFFSVGEVPTSFMIKIAK